MNRVTFCALVSWLGLAAGVWADTVTSAFSFQGHLSPAPSNGLHEMAFQLFEHPFADQPLTEMIVFDGLGSNPPPVSFEDGNFTVILNFGDSSIFDGKAVWLEIWFRPPFLGLTKLLPRLEITPAPYAQGLKYPQTANADLVSPMFQMTQSGEGSAMKLEGQRDPVIITSASPLFSVSSHGGGVAASIASEPVPDPMWTPDPTIPTFISKNRIGGVAGSFVLEPPPDPWVADASVPALAVMNRANGVAGSFYVPNPDLPIEDGCPPQCPPFPWPWVDVVAPGIDVINQSGGPAGRFATDSNLLLPAVHVENKGTGSGIIIVNNSEPPTLEATNNSGGSAGKFEAVAFNPQPDPPQPALVATHQGGGGAAKFESVAFNPQPDPPVPTVEAIHQGGGSAGKFEIYAFNPQPDPPQPAIVANHHGGGGAAKFESFAFNPQPDPPQPTVDAIHGGGGMAGRFVGLGALAALEATNTGAGPAMKALSSNGGSFAFEATNSAGTAIRAIGGNGICFDGEGDLRITGEFTKNYGNGSPSFHRTGPVAYATINQDGTVAAGTPNVSCVWNLPNQRYEITLTGESYSTTGYVTTVTPVAIAPAETLFANTSSGLGQLRVRILSTTTGTVGQQKPFHFVVYKP